MKFKRWKPIEILGVQGIRQGEQMRDSCSLLSLCLIALIVTFPRSILAQSSASDFSGKSSTLNEQQERGRGLFFQRCALCHLPPQEIKPQMRPSSGPILNGLLNDATPQKEKAFREYILKGGPGMPGFQYALKADEVDDLMAFSKTLNDFKAYMDGLAVAQVASSSDSNLAGTVKSSDGKLLEGIGVSARADGKTFTTTVYTDLKGEYLFPPLEAGQFTIRAQAVGFQAGKAELKLSAGQTMRQDFTLQPLKDFSKQLSGTEWMDSLPEDTPQDRRMKMIVQRNCSSCHVSSFILDHRFDASGWGTIINLMSRISIYAFTERDEAHPDPAIQMYKEELVSYLVRVLGPNSPPLKFKPLPRPTGEETQVVVTEYDIPQGDKPGYISAHNGTDWSEGMPSTYEGRAIHDLFIDKENVWIGNTIPLGRTLAKMDQRTGRLTEYTVLAAADNKPIDARGIVKDRVGNLWFISSPNGRPEKDAGVVKFNPTTEKFQVFPKPSTFPRIGHFPALDSKDNVWYPSPDGAVKFDPKTEKFTRYKTESTTTGQSPYECAVDAKDTVWCALMNRDRIIVIDSNTNQVSEIALAPLQDDDNQKDREISARLAGKPSSQGDDATQDRVTNVPPATTPSTSFLYMKGPRRLVVDRTANAVWIAFSWGGRIAKIDTISRKVTEYRVPSFYSTVYGVAVDKNHMVWVNQMNSDRIAKFNPFTEQLTEYPLPTLGAEPRHITVDNSTDPPTVWVPYYRVNKIARVQFRTVSGPTPDNGPK